MMGSTEKLSYLEYLKKKKSSERSVTSSGEGKSIPSLFLRIPQGSDVDEGQGVANLRRVLAAAFSTCHFS